MGIILPAVLASARNNRRRKYKPAVTQIKETIPLASEKPLNANWFKSAKLTNHINIPLLHKIYSQIDEEMVYQAFTNTRQTLKKYGKKLEENEEACPAEEMQILLQIEQGIQEILAKQIHLKIIYNELQPTQNRTTPLQKSYQILAQCLLDYQKEAETIYSTREELNSHALFLTIVFGLPLILCIIFSAFSPPMLPVTLTFAVILTSFIGSSLYSANELRGKHPANETELNFNFKNFMYTLEKYMKNKSANNSETSLDQSSENTPPYPSKQKCSANTSNLNCNTSFFNLVDSPKRTNHNKRGENYTL